MFTIGDKVTWSSQSNGSTTTKLGIVAAVVPANITPNGPVYRGIDIAAEYTNLTCRYGCSLSRDHVSYLVAVRPRKTEKSSPVLYWPRVNSLRAA